MKKTGAGYNIPRNPRKSHMLYGHLVDPTKKNEPMVINDKMVRDQVYTSKKCRTTRSDFLAAMCEFANNPNIQWENGNSKATFLQDCERTWDRAA